MLALFLIQGEKIDRLLETAKQNTLGWNIVENLKCNLLVLSFLFIIFSVHIIRITFCEIHFLSL